MRPCACCPCFLSGCSCFLPGGRFPFCWLLSGAPGFQSFFSFSSAQISLSLSALLAPASRPWGFPGWHMCLSWIVPRHLLVAFLLVSLNFYAILFRSLFPTFLVGSSSFASLDALPVRSSGLSEALVALLALSSAFCQVIDRCLLSSLWFGWCSASFPAALHPVSLSLAYWLFTRLFCHGS